MKRIGGWIILGAALAGSSVAVQGVHAGEAVDTPGAPATEEASPTEAESLAAIERLTGSLHADMPLQVRLALNAAQLSEIVSRSDAFLKRFPGSPSRDKVLIAKLSALAGLARTRPEHLEQLLSLTAEIAAGTPSESLASENGFYAIQAFVIAARNEGMDRKQLMAGTAERYRAFLKDHPRSRWSPIVGASLVRNLLAQGKEEDARLEVGRLEKAFPNDRATKRAQGELFRATAVGKPFGTTLKAPDGTKVDTESFASKVLLLHFWSGTNSYAMEGIESLRKLHETYADKGLALIGINLDKDRGVFEQSIGRLNLPWAQYRETDGLSGDLVVSLGVIRIPTYYVIDRKGVLRYTNPGVKLGQVVGELVSEGSSGP